MRVTHDVEPFVGRRLAIAMQQAANAVDEYLRAAAGNAVEPRGDKTIDDLGYADRDSLDRWITRAATTRAA